MARILIVYGTTEGHTATIASRMAAAMRTAGHTVDVRDAKDMLDLAIPDGYDGVVVGGSLHASEYQSSVRDFARLNRQRLVQMPSAFFSVSLAAADADDDARREVQTTIDKFTVATGWRPARVAHIAGALVYSHYNFFIRHLMKLIVKRHGRDELDTSRDYDFTDWPAVTAFARDFAAHLGQGATAADATPALQP